MGASPSENGQESDPQKLHAAIKQFEKRSFDHSAVVDLASWKRPNVIASDRIAAVFAVLGNLAWLDDGQLPEFLRVMLRTVGTVAGSIVVLRFAFTQLLSMHVGRLHQARIRKICDEVRQAIPALTPEVNLLEAEYIPSEHTP